jgi:hypothetical protein
MPLSFHFDHWKHLRRTPLGDEFSSVLPGTGEKCRVWMPGCQIDGPRREEIRRLCECLESAGHPSIAAMDWLDTLDGPAIVIHCPPDAPSVLAFTRKEGARSIEMLLPFLLQAGSAMDHAQARGFRLRSHPRDVIIRHSDSGIEPLFTIGFPGELDAEDREQGEDPAMTILALEPNGARAASPTADLATLIYWMVAARMPSESVYHNKRSFKAIEGLSEPGNSLLCSAFCGKFHGTCGDLLAAICRVEGLSFAFREPTAARIETTAPTSPLDEPVPPATGGGRLRLRGLDPAGPVVEIVADTVFRIGRQRGTADLVARFLPRDAANDALTRGLSKEHARLEFRDGAVVLIDAGSTNGTLWKGASIERKPCPIAESGEIGLATGVGSHFKVGLVLVPPPDPHGTGEWGCALLLPSHQDEQSPRYLWLFGQAAVGSRPGLPLTLDDPAIAPVQAILVRENPSVWIHNLADNGSVRVDGLVLRAGESARLSEASQLRIGGCEFALEAD